MHFVILPTLNEREGVKRIVPLLLKDEKCKVIIADDGSTDGTAEAARSFEERVIFLDRSKEREHGLCASVLEAIGRVGSGFFVVMDADGQHPAEKACEIVAALENGADIVVCEREDWGAMPLHRQAISLGATMIANASLFVRGKRAVRDPMSGFFGMRGGVAAKILRRSRGRFVGKGYKVLFEMLKFAPNGMKIASVKFQMGQRGAGESKIGARHVLYLLESALR